MAVTWPSLGRDGPPVDGDAARRSLAIAAFLPGWIGLAALVLVTLAGVSVPVADRYWMLLATAAVLGLPHGAIDHLTVPRARGTAVSLGWVGSFSVGYLAAAGAFVAVWLVAPALAFLLFVALTWYHWGQGDRFPLTRLAGATHLRDRCVRRGTTVVRGGVPMIVPLLAFPSRYRAVADAVLGLFGAGGSLDWLVRVDVRLAAGLVLALATVATLGRGWQVAEARPAWWLDAGETALLW